jgi:hypothetical protein
VKREGGGRRAEGGGQRAEEGRGQSARQEPSKRPAPLGVGASVLGSGGVRAAGAQWGATLCRGLWQGLTRVLWGV